jgi:benzoyl-CoA reductase/2-hydroxyglutaryl-CoA dehydratase subunit BcrC/BadD/HgdB
MRAKTLAYFDQLIANSAVALKEHKDAGKKIVGYYCLFSPVELIEAAGAIPVGLCATKEEPIVEAEKVLPRNLCPLIKSSYGFAVSGKCPFFHFSDVIMAETTCDGKKKMYELMGKIKPMIVLDIPNSANYQGRKGHWINEIKRTKEFLASELAVEITEEKLSEAIRAYNNRRRLLMELAAVNKHNPTPITGTDLLKVFWGHSFQLDTAEYLAKVKELIAELKDIVAAKNTVNQGPRILVTGTPTGVGQEKVMKIIQEGPAQVVLQEACSGIKGFMDLVDENGDPFEALAEKYMNIPCSCTSPNQRRFELIGRLVEEYNIQGVVDITLQACHTYNIESYSLKEYLRTNHNISLLQVETDYSESDVQQIKLRVDAFLEVLE